MPVIKLDALAGFFPEQKSIKSIQRGA